MAVNPDPLEELEEDTKQEDHKYNIDPWVDKKEKKEFIPSKGTSTKIYTDGKARDKEVSAFKSGIGDNDDLFVKQPDTEEMELDFKYAARLRGKKKHETMIYPEIPFEYGIHYEGEQLVTDNEAVFNHRVDAYPGKSIKYSVTERDPQPTYKDWEVKMIADGRVRQDEFHFAVNWKANAAVEAVRGAANLFTSARGNFIGPGPRSVWNKHGNYVREIDNRSHGSGIIAKEFYEWDDYEAEYEFKPIKATGVRDDPNAKVLVGDRLYSIPGADDDVLGFIFRAQKNNKDFYIFLWEGDNTIVSSRRAKSLNGYNMLTGNISGSYTHSKAEEQWNKYTDTFYASELGINFYNGMKLSSTQLNNYRNLQRRKGWGTQHYRLYRVTNGVMREVTGYYKGDGRGWIQDWQNLNYKNSVKIRCTGRRVRIYIQSYRQGNFNPNNYRLAVDFNVPSNFLKGSVGLATFSQAVQFEKIKVTRWEQLEGRVPSSGWSVYKDPGSKQLAKTGAEYVASSVRQKARSIAGFDGDFEVTSVSAEVRKEVPGNVFQNVGSISLGVNKPVIVSTSNPKDAGKIREITIIKKGTAFITPLQVSPETAHVVFDNAHDVFGRDLQLALNKDPDIIRIERTRLQVIKPSYPDEDWHLKGERFTLWNRNPEIRYTTKDFEHKVYAYEGWKMVVDLRQAFNGLQWATYTLKVVPETINDEYDQIEIKNEKVYMKTTEWYEGIYPADIKNEGIVTNKEDVFVDIPPMPEHFVHPETREVMYHGYEDVRFLLIQLRPRSTQEVWMGFKSKFDKENTKITTEPLNVINGRPVIWTDKINDQVQIHCADKPRWVPWHSGKYIGYGKVNGRRPFFKDGMGKADMVDVPANVVFIPDYIERVKGPFIEVNDKRVQYEIDYENKTVRFFSDHMDAYVWYTDWYTDWKECDTEYSVKTDEIKVIDNPIELNPFDDPYYDVSDTIIETFEVISTNPFVDVWTDDISGKGQGLQGSYYQFPLISHIIAESFQVKGDYHEMIQKYTIKQYMKDRNKVEIEIQTDKPFKIIEVKINGQKINQNSTNGWALNENKVTIRGSAISVGEAEVKYSIGDYSNQFELKKPLGKGITVFHKGKELSKNQYNIADGKLIVNKDLLFLHDWIHVQSYISEDQFDPEKKNYLGDFVGARIDPEIWFDWKDNSPLFDFIQNNEMSASSIKMLAAISDKIRFRYNLEMEIVKPVYEPVDISNFTGEWVQWDEIRVEEGGLNGPGDWHGPPEPGYPEVTNLRNQNGRSGWYNPNHLNLTDYEFGFHVQVRGGDDDMYGAIFKFDAETQNFYSFEWDAYLSLDPPSGGTGVRGMAIYKNICLNPGAPEEERLRYNKIRLAHVPLSWSAHQNEINTIRISTIGNRIRVWTNGVLRMDVVDNDNPFLKGAWGPVTQSQPNTYFWDFWLQNYHRVTPEEESTFRIPMDFEVDRPVIDEDPIIELNIDKTQIGSRFNQILNNYLSKHELSKNELLTIDYFIRGNISDYSPYFKNSNESGVVYTTREESTVFAKVEGKDPPQSQPIESPIPNQKEPYVPPIPLPEADPNNNFAASWEGYIYAPETGFYEFNIRVDDAVRMWVNNNLIIDEWDINGSSEFDATIYLEGNKWYPIKVNYADVFDKAHIFLRWKKPNDYLKRIEPEYLAPYLDYKIKAEIKKETPYPWKPLIHNGYYYFGYKENYLYAKKIVHKLKVDKETLVISPRPKQGSPILINTVYGRQLRKVSFYDENWSLTLRNKETFSGNGSNKYYLKYKDIDPKTLNVYLNGEKQDITFDKDESSITFGQKISQNDTIEVDYILLDSFYMDINYDAEKDEALIVFHDYEKLKEVEVIYEESNDTPFYRAKAITTNPILNHNHRGFLYLTETENIAPKSVYIHVSPKEIGTLQNEKVNVTGQVYDALNNPVPEKEVKIYRDGKLIFTGKTNEAGEVVYQDKPPVTDEMFAVYKIVCDDLENTALLNFYENDIVKRDYIEVKAGKSSIIAGSNDTVRIYITLRDHAWYVRKNKKIKIEYTDTKGTKHLVEKTTDENGQVFLDLSGKDEVNGVIHVVASYHDGVEGVKNQIYIKSIGG